MNKPLPEPSTEPRTFYANPIGVPSDISEFVPRCIVCTNEVPPRRRTGHSKETCSNECKKVLKAYRRWNVERRFCPNCRHPNTPEERKQFIAWRKATGSMKATRGNPVDMQKNLIYRTEAVAAMKTAIQLLEEYGDPECTSEVREHIDKLKNLIDVGGRKGRTLRPKAQPTETLQGE